MYKKLIYIIAAFPVLTANAEEVPVSKWSGDAELGYLRTTGNTDTESLHARGKIVNEREMWRHTGTLEITNKQDSGVDTADRWYVTGKSDYNINDASYLFGLLSYEDDAFSGYEYQANAVLGYGYHVIKQDNLTLDLEGGVGARRSKLLNDGSNTEGLVRGAADLKWVISPTSTFSQLLTVEVGEDSTISRSVSALTMQIVGNLAAKLAHTIRHASEVPPGIDKTDTETVATLVYSFK